MFRDHGFLTVAGGVLHVWHSLGRCLMVRSAAAGGRGGGTMQARDVKNAADARSIVEARGLTHIKLGLVDIDGVMRGKYVSRDKFFSALESGFGFCDVVLGWDSNDQLVDNLAYTGWHTAYPDAPARIVPESRRV